MSETPTATPAVEQLYIPGSGEAVTRVGFTIFFNAIIDHISISKLIAELIAVQNEVREHTAKGYPAPERIKLYVTSYGGILDAGLAAMDFISSSDIPIDTIALGVVASAGTLLTLSGQHKYITPSTRFMVHQFTGGAWGTYQQLKVSAKNHKNLDKFLMAFYLKHSKLPKKKLRKLLNKDLYLNAKQVVKYGMADTVGVPW
jgi:ATP-dependent Clp endopeptidase proteolytic subunit ClpP